MRFQRKDVSVLFVILQFFVQLPLLTAYYQDLFLDQYDDGSGDGELETTPVNPQPRCISGTYYSNGELYCDANGNLIIIDLIIPTPSGSATRPPPIIVKTPPQPPIIILPTPKPRRTTTKRPPRITTKRTPRTTTKRTPRTTTTRAPRTTTTRTPRTTTKRTPRTTTLRTPRTTTTRTTTTRTTTSRPTTTPKPCKPTVTKVRGDVPVCGGQTIFEDNFDSFRDKMWRMEHYIPSSAPELPFVSYQNLPTDPTVIVENGELRIAPKLQEKQPGFTNDTIFTGAVDLLQGCTSSTDVCQKQAFGADILPPIVSGRIVSKGFAFMYGIVTVRAKLPQGDWLYPEILLEPFLQKYGSKHFSSGIINIASARGNRELKSRTSDYSNKVLFGGPVMDAQCYDTLLSKKKLKAGRWGDDFHKFSLVWTPDNITLLVDGKRWAHVEPSPKGLRDQFSRVCGEVPRSLLGLGTKIAPFDEFFHLTVGVAAGSIKNFPDRVLTENGRAKPWTNFSRKALLNFWRDMEAWYATWNQPELLVDYIKVVAL